MSPELCEVVVILSLGMMVLPLVIFQILLGWACVGGLLLIVQKAPGIFFKDTP